MTINIDKISYKGHVKLTAKMNNKVVKEVELHNTGTPLFYHILASAVCGNDERFSMPNYIDLIDKNNANKSELVTPIGITRKVVKQNTDGNYYAELTASIPYSVMLINNSTFINKHLVLYAHPPKSINIDSILAEIQITQDIGSELDDTLNSDNLSEYQLLVSWQLYFGGAENNVSE